MERGDYMNAYKYKVMIDGNEVFYGYDPIKQTLALFGGSYYIAFPVEKFGKMTRKQAENDLIKNYQQYKNEDLEATYRAWGYYD